MSFHGWMDKHFTSIQWNAMVCTGWVGWGDYKVRGGGLGNYGTVLFPDCGGYTNEYAC